MNGGKEIMSGFIVACGDGSELFELTEGVFDEMTYFIKFLVVRALDLAVGLGENDRCCLAFRNGSITRWSAS